MSSHAEAEALGFQDQQYALPFVVDRPSVHYDSVTFFAVQLLVRLRLSVGTDLYLLPLQVILWESSGPGRRHYFQEISFDRRFLVKAKLIRPNHQCAPRSRPECHVLERQEPEKHFSIPQPFDSSTTVDYDLLH